MKVNVENGWGVPVGHAKTTEGYFNIDYEKGTEDFDRIRFEAPGIPNGTHECELVLQCKKLNALNPAWFDIDETERGFYSEFSVQFRQIYRLSPLKEQGERSGVKTASDIAHEIYFSSGLRDGDIKATKAGEAMIKQYATQLAEAVYAEVIKRYCSVDELSIHNINISDFIK